MSNTPNLITIWMSSRGKIFFIYTKIKLESAGVYQAFLRGRGVTCTSGLQNEWIHARKVLPFANPRYRKLLHQKY